MNLVRLILIITLPGFLAACQANQSNFDAFSFAGLTKQPAKRPVAKKSDATSIPEIDATSIEGQTASLTPSLPSTEAVDALDNSGEGVEVPSEAEVVQVAMSSFHSVPKRRPSLAAATNVTRKSGKRLTPQQRVAQRRKKYQHIIAKHARANGVPVSLALAVVEVESNYRVSARGAAGEIGLMQLLPRTARYIGYKGKMKNLYNPDTNIRFGMKYLGKAYKLGGGSTCGAILKYNAGHGAKRMNKISRKYCERVQNILRRT